MDDPMSPDYHLYLKGNPEALVGRTLVCCGLQLVDYSPDWCKNPDDWSPGVVVSVDEENQTYVRKSNDVVGKVTHYDGDYHIEYDNPETEHPNIRRMKDSTVIHLIRMGRWFAE
jgi:hypothetical protein